MPALSSCSTCGTPLSGRMLGGLCPACVRRVAMAEPSLPGDTKPEVRARRAIIAGWEPPSVEEVAALLPAGAYRVESLIGRGGMGAVYKGWQKSLDRHVAIKILPRGLVGGDVDFAARFKREAKAMAKLKHPGIIPVHDAGETTDGLLFFVMDFVEGTDVQKMLATRRSLPPEEALPITSSVLDALSCAHQHGIIHRDIKPANVMVDSAGHVLVADFGLARHATPDATAFTGSHVAMGTPDYMPPEAQRGLQRVDHRADLFAVGVMLYQMLTGHLPMGRFEPPSRVVPGLDRGLDRIVDKLLQGDREKRPATALEVKAALEPILTRTRARRVQDARRRKRTSILIAAAVVLIAASAVFLWKKHRSPADAQSAAATTDAALATKELPFVNSLGMRFIPVPINGGPTNGERVLFSVWETRVQDYAVFVKETQREAPDPDYRQEPTHPVVLVSWQDAQEFCAWLTARERQAGTLGTTEVYRLPSDHEWSCAAGIGGLEDAAAMPSGKSQKLADRFPWGAAWPPPKGAGNLASEELRPELNAREYALAGVIAGFRDGFAFTAPVGSFTPNGAGLHDLSGNVWEWCADWYDGSVRARVVRGGSWAVMDRIPLLTSFRVRYVPDARNSSYGFRCVRSAAPAEASPISPPFVASSSAAATKDAPFVNTLRMRFIPVPITGGPTDGQRVLFSVWETRVQDYVLFATETQHEWPKPIFPQKPTHPAVMVSWDDAQAFCAWLTERERKAGKLSATEAYRLPSDHEWSCAVGIGDREDAATLPKEKSQKLADVFPWGSGWPPPIGAGNFAGEEWQTAATAGQAPFQGAPIAGFEDGHLWTAPVSSFPPSSSGLHDLAGNVWEWCEDWYDAAQTGRVARGGNWSNRDRNSQLSSYRIPNLPDERGIGRGFRCVLAAVPATATRPSLESSPALATQATPFINTLGMKFVPVPITGPEPVEGRVLFSVWETRVQDYEVFASATRHEWPKPPFALEPAHPVVLVTWDDAMAFCVWLTERERKAGKLAPNARYRLPTDHEWSCAVGIGERENSAVLPSEKNEKLGDVFPWGSVWPPPAGAGNFSGEETVGHEFNKPGQKSLTGYRDEFIATAPVGSFTPNRLSLHDLGGNVWEWCEDWHDATQKDRVKRGGGWDNTGLMSSCRARPGPGGRGNSHGFRCVLELR